MKTEHKLAETLREMMQETPLDEISVVALTKRCHIYRQTFYYHFHDVYDLLTLVYLDERIKNIAYVKTLRDLVIVIYRYYEANTAFVDASLSSAGKDLFQEFIYNNCYTTIFRLVNETKDNKRILSNDRKAVARFYALAYAHSIVYYLSVFKNKSLEGLLDSFCFIKDNDLQKAVQNYIEYKGMPKNDRF